MNPAEQADSNRLLAKRQLPPESLKKLEKTAARVTAELRTPKVIAEKTMLRGLESAVPASRHDPSNIILHDGTYYVWWMERDQVLDDENADSDGGVKGCVFAKRIKNLYREYRTRK